MLEIVDMASCCGVLKSVAAVVLAAMLARGAAGQQQPRRMITYCYNDVVQFRLGKGSIQASIPGEDETVVRLDLGRFSVRRGGRTLITFVVEGFSSDGLMLWSPDGQAFALTYSDGGAIGGFHVRVFQIQGNAATEVTRAIQPAVNAFKARHYCKSRGNNVSAIKWVHDSKHLMLMTTVYPTGDCGPDAGHGEGYLVTIPDGKIERHLTLDQLISFPGICLENDEMR